MPFFGSNGITFTCLLRGRNYFMKSFLSLFFLRTISNKPHRSPHSSRAKLWGRLCVSISRLAANSKLNLKETSHEQRRNTTWLHGLAACINKSNDNVQIYIVTTCVSPISIFSYFLFSFPFCWSTTKLDVP